MLSADMQNQNLELETQLGIAEHFILITVKCCLFSPENACWAPHSLAKVLFFMVYITFSFLHLILIQKEEKGGLYSH